jgi:alpha-amylase/alpha-mannosidase (GH57 family)
MTKVAILWHMHQPYYEDLATGEHVLPWVRLHALKDYYGMVALLREFPRVKVTFNLVPSLLVQLQAFAEERARDRFLELGLKPVDSLTDADRATIVAEFFHAQRARMIEPYPRYAELLRLRGEGEEDGGGGRRVFSRRAQAFSDTDLLDLQVWHKLAWVDPFYLEQDERVQALLRKGRSFSEQDKVTLRQVELEILRRVVPEYRAAAERGQVELSTSPFYHPILPLLCDTAIYLRTHPQSPMPRAPFRHREDAAEQLARAKAYHERCFGAPPVGLWPSEGSVSDAVVSLATQAGFRWMATDEGILSRTLGRPLSRDRQDQFEQPELIYRPYRLGSGADGIGCLFRDRVLSDLIGFTYAGWNPAEAAAHMVGRLEEAGRGYSARTGGQEATLAIILDGENAWEHFDRGGRPFLRALYARLSAHPQLQTVTMAEAAEPARSTLPSIFPGSWINSDFYIWIGHRDDRKAWSQLADARATFDAAAPGVDERARAVAREEILIAEGSDWFWWYGDDHSSEHDLEFDDLFRRHLRNVYRALDRPVPEELFMTNISTSPVREHVVMPVGFVRPVVDGLASDYFEWLPAGYFRPVETSATMHAGETRRAVVSAVHFGFDPERLAVRLDLTEKASAALERGIEFTLNFTAPIGVQVTVRASSGGTLAQLRLRQADGNWSLADAQGVVSAASEIVEVTVPFADLGVRVGDKVCFFVSVWDGETELEWHPGHWPIEVPVPGPDFEMDQWWTA